jgi:hypothetical protein
VIEGMYSHRFSRYEDGTMKKIFMVDSEPDDIYRISVPETQWSVQISRIISRWVRKFKKGKRDPFRWGTIEKIPKDEFLNEETTIICSYCKKSFKYKSGFSKHKKQCISNQIILKETPNSPEQDQTTRTFGKENPRWLTSELLYGVLSNIPNGIPIMMRNKHFNDRFPENRNIRIDTRRNIDNRLQVFEEGRWMVKGSKQTFYKVLINICDILSDALEEEDEKDDSDVDDGNDSEDSENEDRHIGREIKRLRSSTRFLRKINRIRPLWEKFRDQIQDPTQRVDLWEDLKTFLLDRQLAIEQGFE